MVGTQPWRYGDLELLIRNLSKEQDDFVVGSSRSDVKGRVINVYRDNDGDHHRHHNDKGHIHKGESSSLKGSSEFQSCEAT